MFQLANAIPVSRIGLGCGRLGLDSKNAGAIEREIEALRFGIQKGLNFIDTEIQSLLFSLELLSFSQLHTCSY